MIGGAKTVVVESQAKVVRPWRGVSCNSRILATRVIDLIDDRSPLTRGTHPTNVEFLVCQSSDHIEIDHRHRFFQWEQRIIDVELGTKKPFFLTAECDEN